MTEPLAPPASALEAWMQMTAIAASAALSAAQASTAMLSGYATALDGADRTAAGPSRDEATRSWYRAPYRSPFDPLFWLPAWSPAAWPFSWQQSAMQMPFMAAAFPAPFANPALSAMPFWWTAMPAWNPWMAWLPAMSPAAPSAWLDLTKAMASATAAASGSQQYSAYRTSSGHAVASVEWMPEMARQYVTATAGWPMQFPMAPWLGR